MRSVIQRVRFASVEVDEKVIAKINGGILAFVGFCRDDSAGDLEYIASKIIQLRIFEDENDLMNLSLSQVGGELLIVSQFTLYGDARKGRRPSFSNAMTGELALSFYNEFVDLCKSKHMNVKSGLFGANMNIDLTNSGPVTILLDSNRLY